MIATACEIDDRPSAFRYPRGDGVGVEIPELAAPLEIGRGRIDGDILALVKNLRFFKEFMGLARSEELA